MSHKSTLAGTGQFHGGARPVRRQQINPRSRRVSPLDGPLSRATVSAMPALSSSAWPSALPPRTAGANILLVGVSRLGTGRRCTTRVPPSRSGSSSQIQRAPLDVGAVPGDPATRLQLGDDAARGPDHRLAPVEAQYDGPDAQAAGLQRHHPHQLAAPARASGGRRTAPPRPAPGGAPTVASARSSRCALPCVRSCQPVSQGAVHLGVVEQPEVVGAAQVQDGRRRGTALRRAGRGRTPTAAAPAGRRRRGPTGCRGRSVRVAATSR